MRLDSESSVWLFRLVPQCGRIYQTSVHRQREKLVRHENRCDSAEGKDYKSMAGFELRLISHPFLEGNRHPMFRGGSQPSNYNRICEQNATSILVPPTWIRNPVDVGDKDGLRILDELVQCKQGKLSACQATQQEHC
jgi:hypothetical protein